MLMIGNTAHLSSYVLCPYCKRFKRKHTTKCQSCANKTKQKEDTKSNSIFDNSKEEYIEEVG